MFDRLSRTTFLLWADRRAHAARLRRTEERLAAHAAARRAARTRVLLAGWRMSCLEREVEKRCAGRSTRTAANHPQRARA